MPSNLPRAIQEVSYERWAREYLRSLPPEHFMEATSQARQRAITLQSLALVEARRPDFHLFNELLVQYRRRGQRKPGQVVPDNMVVLTDQPIRASSSYNLPLEPARPFWVLDYVSRCNKRKDYEDSFRQYERELKIPYYLVFYPDNQEWTLYRHNKRRYVTARPNEHGRCLIPELDLEVALLDGWVRFWYQGALLPLPADLLREVDQLRRQAKEASRQPEEEKRQAEAARRQAEEEKRRADELAQRLEAAERELARLWPRSPER